MEFRRLKEMREDNDKNQTQIAKYLKITQQQYSLYEKGIRTIPVEYIIELSKYYKVTTDYLLGLSDTPEPTYKAKNITNINGDMNGGKITMK